MSARNLNRERRRATVNRRLREAKLLMNGALDTDHPIMAHIIPIRRCNLSCTYCNEYDDFSKPVPLDVILHRLELLGRLKTGVITLSGGEPLLHPELDEIIRGIRSNATLAGMITNGYLLTADRVRRLNDAGLDYLQISIDNVMPDDVSKKSLKVLDKKLQILAEHAHFHVNINSVLGGGIRNPEDALVVGQARHGTGFHVDCRNHSRWRRPIAAAGESRARSVSRNEEVREDSIFRRSITFKRRSQMARRVTGVAAPARATCISAKTDWCITAHSNAAFRPSRWRTIRLQTFAANTSLRNPARRFAPFRACIKFPISTSFVASKRARLSLPLKSS